MNILIPDSWLREYLDTKAKPSEIKECLSLCGPSIEKISQINQDFIYHIEITSNRIDMACVYGIAREVAAILPRFGIKTILKPLIVNTQNITKTILPLKISDPKKLCNRIMAVVMEDTVVRRSPEYINNRLENSGVRSLSNLIDITNYVMLETGHPCHVFDYDRIKTNSLIIRKAKKGEVLITLDDKKCILNSEDIVIDDGTGRIIDLPGIMGTKNSVVTSQTKRIIVFIESNNPVNIRHTSMRLGLRTLAATINEKRPDPELVKTTLLRAVDLYKDISSARISGELIDIYPNKIVPKSISTTVNFIANRLGFKLSIKEITDILKSLQFEIKIDKENKILAIPPTFRQFDVTIPEDLVEEIARIYGFHRIPSQLMTGSIPISEKPADLPIEDKAKQILKYQGYTEIYNYSFIGKSQIDKAKLAVNKHLCLTNPLTRDMEYMRISLIPSMLEIIRKNENLSENLALFEMAKIYLPENSNLPREITNLVIAEQENFYMLKGTVEELLAEFGIRNYKTDIKNENNIFWHPKQYLIFDIDNKILARLGKLHPALSLNFSLNKELYLAEIDMDNMVNFSQSDKKYKPISVFPPVIEDLTLLIPNNCYIGFIISEINNLCSLISSIELIDRYKNQITLRLTFLHEKKNLTGEEILHIRNNILTILKEKFHIYLKQ